MLTNHNLRVKEEPEADGVLYWERSYGVSLD